MGWTPPRRPWCARGVVLVTTEQEASVSEVSTIGLDLAKRVFQAHGADASGKVVFRKRLRREQVLAFFAGRPACVVAMEACSSAHHWAREIGELGHTVRLIAPADVKPFVKRQKNDTTDAEAICEAAQRPTMRFVSVKSEAAQANAVVFRARDLLVRQRTQAINALRGHLGEYGVVVAKGPSHVAQLIAHVEDPAAGLPEAARTALRVLIASLQFLSERIDLLDREVARRTREDKGSASSHDHSWSGSRDRDGSGSIGTAGGRFQEGPRLRGLGRAHAVAALQRGQAKTWCDLENGRANVAALVDYWREFRCP
jgi:transposase